MGNTDARSREFSKERRAHPSPFQHHKKEEEVKAPDDGATRPADDGVKPRRKRGPGEPPAGGKKYEKKWMLFILCSMAWDLGREHGAPTIMEHEHVLQIKRQFAWILSQGAVSVGAAWSLWLALLSAAHDINHPSMQLRVESSTSSDSSSCCASPGKQGGTHPCAVIGESSILKRKQMRAIEKSLPPEFQGYAWKLTYAVSRDGASVMSLLDECKMLQPTILVVRDTHGQVFGGLASTAWQELGEDYYGDGRCLLFALVRRDKAGIDGASSSGEEEMLDVFAWTGANSLFMYSSPEGGIGMGGGGNFGIYLDTELYKGCSGRCETFGLSGPLASSQEFVCQDLEVWSLEPDFGATPPAWLQQGLVHKGLVRSWKDL